MKRNLGKFLLLCVFIVTSMEASTYKWSVQANKTQAYVNEAIYLKYSCLFSDTAQLYVVEFTPSIENDDYKIEALREEAKIVDGKKINTYEFILVVKKAGDFNLTLDALMKKTNKDSIENSVLGRDNANYEEFSLQNVKHETIHLNILKSPTPIVGSFSLKVKKSEHIVEAYEPYHLTLEIEGVGDFRKFDEISYVIPGVKVFSEPAIKKISLTQEGESGTWTKKFAFVSESNFTIEPLKVSYFDLKVKELKLDEIIVTVKSPSFTKEELLDDKAKEFSISYEYIYYLLTFIAGFLLAKVKFVKKSKVENRFCKKVYVTNSMNELLVLLVLKNPVEHKELIEQIESGKIKDLNKAKQSICFNILIN